MSLSITTKVDEISRDEYDEISRDEYDDIDESGEGESKDSVKISKCLECGEKLELYSTHQLCGKYRCVALILDFSKDEIEH